MMKHEPENRPGIIRFAVVADPQGAVFYVAKGLIDKAPPALPLGDARHDRLARTLCRRMEIGLRLL